MEPVFQRNEVEKQLDFIKDEVEILYEVNKENQRQMEKLEKEKSKKN